MYKCENVSCALSGPRLREIPAVSNTLPVCPACRRPLRDRGPRPAARRIKILDHGEVVGTEDIGDGEAVTFGTAPDTAIHVDLSMLRNASTLRSRHVRVAVQGGQAVVEPAGDGEVWVQRWLRKAWQSPEVVLEVTTLRRRDRIVLPGGVSLEQSGKDYVVPPEEWGPG
jgi:hypothetical protein